MHTQYLVLGLLGRAILLTAAPLKPRTIFEKRDNLANIETALAPVFGSLSSVDAAVVALDGTPTAANNLLAASQEVQASINQATLRVRATGDLSATKSLKLRKTTDSLAAQTQTTLNDLVSRKLILDQLGVSSVALQSLQQQQAASMSLSGALSQKVPIVGQKEAASDKGNLQSIFAQAIAAYSVPAAPSVPAPAPPAPIIIASLPLPLIKAPAERKDKKKAKGNRHDVDVPVENEV